MPYLEKIQRRILATAIQQARIVAEEGAADAIRHLGIAEDKAPAHVDGVRLELRVKLRAHARSLGDNWDPDKKRLLSTGRLKETAAFEHWHRMLFGRFLVERGLLIHPDLNVAIAREELAELAFEERLPDEWALVERIAGPALPAVFKPDDPVLAMRLAPEYATRLRDIVSTLPSEVFTADDSLGWTYQFWRAAEKDAVNKAGVKIGATELPAVTQLFTEPYMVLFLLHNTIGAWWAGKVLAQQPELAQNAVDENALRSSCAISSVSWNYLRFVREGEKQEGPWRPAAGIFPGWPTNAAEITFCDPCCGSGHFLTEGFAILAALRQHEENLSLSETARAVIRDNLHGLELDERCVQLAAFNVALAAWKFAGEPIALPVPQIAWVGAPPPLSRQEMAELGDDDTGLRHSLEALHDQFVQAPLLGSLLEVGAKDLLDDVLRKRGEAALEKLRASEPERAEGAVAALGLFGAADLLRLRYTLLATNVPFLGRGRQELALVDYIARTTPEANADLATAMLQRIRCMAIENGTVASVTPQNWLFLGGYKELREDLLVNATLSVVAGLGSRAFETITGEVVNAALIILLNQLPETGSEFSAINANIATDPGAKAAVLRAGPALSLSQVRQRRNPDERIVVEEMEELPLLSATAGCFVGFQNGDAPRWIQRFWEQSATLCGWHYLQMPVAETIEFGGRHAIMLWENGQGALSRSEGVFIKGREAWGRKGVLVRQMGDLPVCLFDGDLYDQSASVIVPKSDAHLPAIWAFCSSPEYNTSVRRIDRKMNVTTSTMVKVPFDLAYWQALAAETYPEGLPEPYSDDPTQWLFHGHPAFAERGTELHIALARLAGYRWPAETDNTMRLSDTTRERIALATMLPGTDGNGLLSLHAVGSDRPLADRLRGMLAAAYGTPLPAAREADMVRAADAKLDKKVSRDLTIEGWLRDRAFRQHCVLFHQRPFVWHVSDGLTDGFSAFVNYHRLNRATLEKLTYTLVGDWITSAEAEGNHIRKSRAQQLQQSLKAILEGEAPLDIFVRWKPPELQSIGWEPDLDDGVRLNIRPFMMAEILREQPRGISWGKDRGSDEASAPWFHLGPLVKDKEGKPGNPGDRINAHHLSIEKRRSLRTKAGK